MDHIEELIERVKSLPIEEVIGGEIELKGSGTELDAICPFHNDRHIGSFKINTRKQIWWCFACGTGGCGGVSFYQKLNGLTFKEAVAEVGLKHHVLSNQEAELIRGNQFDPHKLKQLEKPKILAKRELNKKLDPDTLNKVYRTFIDCSDPMPEEFKSHLMEERFLEEEDLENFFLMPHYSAEFMAKFQTALRDQNIDISVLDHTPGFFLHTGTNTHGFIDQGERALGIIAHDEKGRINGIQIRRDTNDKKKRYVWFSTGFADGRNNLSNGTVNSGILDVVPGKHDGCFICTEGKFKALKLQKEGYTTLNMHGVSLWPADKVLQFAKNHHCQKIILCYDADVTENDAVAKSALKFSEKMMDAGLDVYYLYWSSELGKGVDDMINNGYRNKLRLRKGSWMNQRILEPLVEKAAQEFKKAQ